MPKMTDVLCSECDSHLILDGETDEQTNVYKLYVAPCETCASKISPPNAAMSNEMTMEQFITEAAALLCCATYKVTPELLLAIIECGGDCQNCKIWNKRQLDSIVVNEED